MFSIENEVLICESSSDMTLTKKLHIVYTVKNSFKSIQGPLPDFKIR